MKFPGWRFKQAEEEQAENGRRAEESAWSERFANLQSAYTELTHVQFELERRAEEIAETRDLFQQVISSMPDALFLTDRSGCVIRANPAAAALLECSETSILGRPLTTVCGSDEIPATPWRLMELAPSGQLANLEVDLYTMTGVPIPVNFSLGLMHDKQHRITGVLAVARDLRDHRSLIDSLVAARARYQELFEFAPDAMVLANQEGQIVLVNSQTEKLFGYRREELLGQPVELVWSERLRLPAREEAMVAGGANLDRRPRGELVAGAGEVEQVELLVADRGGRRFPAEITRRQIETEEGWLEMHLIRDITGRKLMEDECVELLRREQSARQVAEEESYLKDDFLALISHELRAPLTAILGWAQMLRSGRLDRASAERAILTIERNAKSQAHLVGDLLDASRMATGKLSLDVRPLELRSIVDAAVDAVRPSVEAKNLRMQIVLDPWVGPFNGDAERLKQVVWNLLSNAIKFTPAGGLVEVRLERLEDKALLIVSDTGKGLDPEVLAHLFDPAGPDQSFTPSRPGGLGLGLAIVKHLVDLHGGAIYAYSRGAGQGSDFMVTLPLAIEPDDSSADELWPVQTNSETEAHASTLRGTRILIVEDDVDTREILSVILTRYETEVRTAVSAAQAFEILTRWRPEVVISDLRIPVEDGYALISKIRSLPLSEGGGVPAIALTAFAGAQDRERSLAAGFQHHLSKPIEPLQLARVVAHAIGRSLETSGEV